MDQILPIALGIPISLGFASLIFFLLKKPGKKKAPSPNSSPTPTVEEHQQAKNYEILHEALKRSENILTAAQAESNRMIQEAQVDVKRAEQEQIAKLNAFVKQYEDTLTQTYSLMNQSINMSLQKFDSFLKDLQKQGEHLSLSSQQVMQGKIDRLFEQLENKLSEFLVESEQKTIGAIELELRSARQLIDTYRQQQLKLVDENVVAMLEKTLALVMNKRLSLKEHLDLVYESLERAKLEKFIV